jgi:hypothetical protein
MGTHRQLIERLFDEWWNGRRLDRIGESYAPASSPTNQSWSVNVRRRLVVAPVGSARGPTRTGDDRSRDAGTAEALEGWWMR